MKSVRLLLGTALALMLSLCLLLPVRADFSDVPADHWAYAYVERAEEAGAVNGVGGGLFDPESSVTEAQFCAMLLRTLSGVPVDNYDPGTRWYDPYMAAAADTGLTADVFSSPDAPLSRCQMAQIMFNLVRGPRDEARAAEVLASVPDGFTVPNSFRYAVAFVYSAGLIRGMDAAGSFRGDLPMTRAQAAAVWCRLADYLEEFGVNDEIPGESAEPGNPGEPEIEDVPPEQTDPESAEPVPEDTAEITEETGLLTVDGLQYRIGMSADELTGLAGEPDEILEAFGGFRWYVFGTEDYLNRFFAAGVAEDRTVTLLSAGKAFSCAYMGQPIAWGDTVGGLPHGSRASDVTAEGRDTQMHLYLDKNDGYILHMVYLAENQYMKVRYYAESFSATKEQCAGEAKMLLHLTNAFRAAHGVRSMMWDPVAEEAARLHAEDMTAGSYFSHNSADGRSPGDRLKAAGMTSWHTYGENIANAYWGAVESHAGWIASEGHRANLLKEGYTRFGAGFGYDGYVVNSVEDFYAEMGE